MSDQKYLLPEPPKPEATAPRPHPTDTKLARAAIIISLLSATFTGWQTYGSGKIAEQAQGPFIEIIDAEFIKQNNLRMKCRNIGKTTAFHLHNIPEAHYLRLDFDRLQNKSSMRTLFVDKLGDLHHPDAPVDKEFETYAYLRDPGALRRFYHFEYQEDMVVQLRGSFKYSDSRQNVYYIPWCYQTFQPYKTAKPGWSACNDLE